MNIGSGTIIAGLALGMVGFFVACLCAASACRDEAAQRMQRYLDRENDARAIRAAWTARDD
jgi:hypothetical protein